MNHGSETSSAHEIPPPLKAENFSWPDFASQSQLQIAAETRQSGGHIYPAQGHKIGEILKSLGIIDDKILSAVEKRHQTKKASDKPTGELLVYMGIIEAQVLTRALCIQFGVPMVNLETIDIPTQALKLVPNAVAGEKRAIPVGVHNGILYLAVADPFNFAEQNFFALSTGLKIKPVFAPHDQISICLHSKWDGANAGIWAG